MSNIDPRTFVVPDPPVQPQMMTCVCGQYTAPTLKGHRCAASTKLAESLALHRAQVEAENAKPWKCDQCGELIPRLSQHACSFIPADCRNVAHDALHEGIQKEVAAEVAKALAAERARVAAEERAKS